MLIAPVAQDTPAAQAQPQVMVKVKLAADTLFGFDQDSLQADGKQALDTLAEALKSVDVDAIQVTGHTDRLGSKAYNAKLSTRRAQAVKNYLVQMKGIAESKVTAVGMGASQPETPSTDCKGKLSHQALVTCLRIDRRVDVQVLGAQAQ